MLKDTALGTIILYPELLTAAKTLGSAYANTVPAYIVVAIIFIIINYTLTRVASFVERGSSDAATPPAPVTDTVPNIVAGPGEPGAIIGARTLPRAGANP